MKDSQLSGSPGSPNYAPMFENTDYIQSTYFYYLSTGKLPNITSFFSLNAEALLENLKVAFSIPDHNILVYEKFLMRKKSYMLSMAMIIINPGLMVCIEGSSAGSHAEVLYDSEVDQNVFDEVIQITRDTIMDDNANGTIGLLYQNSNGNIEIKRRPLKPFEMDLSLSYNDDFLPVHEIIKEKLSKPQSNGIVLLHGLPGTGKTTYIRYLSSMLKKNLIYIPPDFAHRIASPEFITLMLDHSNSILIIEDAENIICDRNTGDSLSVANLLNISDGLLSDCLSIQLICTFNTDISKIDKALLRKGRIIARYEFKELSLLKSQELAFNLGYTEKIEKPMTIADVYNLQDYSFQNVQSKRVGFYNEQD